MNPGGSKLLQRKIYHNPPYVSDTFLVSLRNFARKDIDNQVDSLIKAKRNCIKNLLWGTNAKLGWMRHQYPDERAQIGLVKAWKWNFNVSQISRTTRVPANSDHFIRWMWGLLGGLIHKISFSRHRLIVRTNRQKILENEKKIAWKVGWKLVYIIFVHLHE